MRLLVFLLIKIRHWEFFQIKLKHRRTGEGVGATHASFCWSKKGSLKYKLFRRTNCNAITQSVTDSFSFHRVQPGVWLHMINESVLLLLLLFFF